LGVEAGNGGLDVFDRELAGRSHKSTGGGNSLLSQ
jgi:hypothetical protein